MRTERARWTRTLAWSAAEIAILLAAHRLLLTAMAGGELVSAVLAGGSHLPPFLTAMLIAFVVVRFMAVVALPGMILCRIGLVVFDWVEGRQRRSP